ncbi:glycoside hydrolase family 47 protein [Pseudocercospora fijiensis CIRAD86]|uniref:alpha-1,2-Mannosidase n=1 Tax=Pseudocercospora fijiensis (strain CIRAD86) TaxID=383855 RepID=M2ZTZ9_PSEFD|nr:glycoside hydrolase family 47 protein [Pseudocercospora fijiensis CIRAD86]EME82479.1 glycoside hydrolase family 47 protein [Pseudocercospora fijiensis CIRAD86]
MKSRQSPKRSPPRSQARHSPDEHPRPKQMPRSMARWSGLGRISTTLLAATLLLLWWIVLTDRGSEALERTRAQFSREDWDRHREEVKEVFIDSWDAYAEHAWGHDRFHPLSKKGSQMSPKGLGWIIVDSLDTLMLMNLTSRLADARRWVSRSLDYEQDQDVNTFETTIRMLGGLLSAHYLSKELPGMSSARDYVYLSKARDLADRLLGAYDSPSGIPFASIDLRSGKGIRSHSDGGSSSTAEATTLQMEMKYLANLTGVEAYWRRAENVMKVVDEQRAAAGLVPIFINADSGRFTTGEVRLGSRGDSYYEYLIKQYLHTSEQEPVYLDMWQESLHGIEQHLLVPTKNSKLLMVAELPQGVGGPLSPKMDHLVCFLPGAIALGATNGLTEQAARKLPTWTAQKSKEMHLARELMKSCHAMYKVTKTGLAPEIVWFNMDEQRTSSARIRKSRNSPDEWRDDFIIKPLDAHNLQRPESVESLFVMWRITGDSKYRQWGLEIFNAFRKHTAVELAGGYTSLENVNEIPPPRRDNMESFWLAETLKYLYLLFSPVDFLPLDRVVFNTEAHVLPRIELGKFSTGWTRTRT